MAAPPMNRFMATHPVIFGLVKIFVLLFNQLPIAKAAPADVSSLARSTESPGSSSEPGLWLYLSVSAALVLSGGAFAGLTIALMGQDEVYLQVIKTSGDVSERKNAASVLHLIKKGKHWVLVTLLLSNVITNETLPIVLDRTLGGGWPAVLGSTALIVIFGEIVPQSICVRYGLPIGAWMAPFVLALMYIMSPIAWPVAKLLDRLLGEDHGTIYKKAGLKTLVTLHKTLGEAGEQLNSDEVTIISAVLDLKEKAVGSIMTPMEDVFTMSADTVLDEPTMDLILSQGYSRIPIHSPDNHMNFVGMLLVKMLITYDPEDGKTVRDFALATLPETRPETSCLDIVNFFQEGKSHMVLVSEFPGEDTGTLGVVTLEDVIEELIGEEIIDESDVFVDVHKAIRRMTPAPKSRVPKGKIVEDPVKSSSVLDGEPFDSENAPKSPKTTEADRRRSSVEAPPPRFQLRKQLSDSNYIQNSDGWVTQRGATDEIREHLKHLGPSNLASRPRQTRYQSVKIKRGGASPSRSGQTDVDSSRSNPDMQSRQSVSIPPSHQGGIGAGLLQSAGHDAKDGAHAVQLGYGTMGPGPTAKEQATTSPNKDLSQISIPEVVTEEQEDRSRNRTRQNSQESATGSVRSYDSRNGDRSKANSPTYRHRGPARSGSITEQVVDVNGIRKVVLHTTGSPCSSETEGRRSSKDKDAHQDKNHFLAVTSDPESDSQSARPNPSTNGNKKKRRRKRRGHGSKKSDSRQSEENQPLLSR